MFFMDREPFGDLMWFVVWQMSVDEEKLKQLPCTAVAGHDLQYLVFNDEAMKTPCSILLPNSVEAIAPPLPIKIKIESV